MECMEDYFKRKKEETGDEDKEGEEWALRKSKKMERCRRGRWGMGERS